MNIISKYILEYLYHTETRMGPMSVGVGSASWIGCLVVLCDGLCGCDVMRERQVKIINIKKNM